MDPDCPSAGAVASRGGRVVYVGTGEGVSALTGNETVVLDLPDATVTPGLIDTHNHLMKLGLDLDKIIPSRVRSIAELIELIRSQDTDGWIWVFGEDHCWEPEQLSERRMPDRHELDRGSDGNPVVCHCGPHAVSLNTAAIRSLEDRWEAVAQYCERDDGGELTGRLVGKNVTGLVKKLVPAPGERELKDAASRAMDRVLASGVTSVLDPGRSGAFRDDIRAYGAVASGGRLPVRVTLMWRPALDRIAEELDLIALQPPLDGQFLASGYVKLFADGEIEDALMTSDYPGRPGYRGMALTNVDELARHVARSVVAGYRVCTHAVGDAAVDMVLDAYEQVLSSGGGHVGAGRLSIAHAFILGPDRIERCRRLGVVLHVQPSLAWAFGDEMIECWGREKASASNPFRTLMNSGIVIGAGSDVYPPDAATGLWAAVTRNTLSGDVLGEAECLTASEALELYTVRGAEALGRSGELGAIAVGKLCDLAVFGIDPVACPIDELREARTLATVVGGRVVRRDGV